MTLLRVRRGYSGEKCQLLWLTGKTRSAYLWADLDNPARNGKVSKRDPHSRPHTSVCKYCPDYNSKEE
jgi:hypothetical protein